LDRGKLCPFCLEEGEKEAFASDEEKGRKSRFRKGSLGGVDLVCVEKRGRTPVTYTKEERDVGHESGRERENVFFPSGRRGKSGRIRH